MVTYARSKGTKTWYEMDKYQILSCGFFWEEREVVGWGPAGVKRFGGWASISCAVVDASGSSESHSGHLQSDRDRDRRERTRQRESHCYILFYVLLPHCTSQANVEWQCSEWTYLPGSRSQKESHPFSSVRSAVSYRVPFMTWSK